ncbi:MAG TPA: hypothetical protein PK513_00975 [Alphaproteobacteria bacterium]|nr:hypothetical protein [Alphaproteobacteria bacterium]USO05869.1 MAG: hypothetical protein H6859_01300 [Rhodospirillales bacterium]HOO81060.1 hypothetical protein [Alphaproteobacteria bacterium]
MSIWFVLWFFISAALLGFLGWSLLILYQQKKTWKAFAAKHKLRFKPNSMMEGAEMEGNIDSYKVSFFTSEHLNPDMRSSRKLTAVEVGLHSTMPIDGAIASGQMISFIKTLNFKMEVRPKHKDWSLEYLVVGDNRFVLDAYLTDERIELLVKLMKIKNSCMVLIFKGDRMLLRVDMADPMISAEYLDRFVKLLLKAAKTLEVSSDEAKKLKAEEVRGVGKDSSLVLDDTVEAGASGLQLEDDDLDAGDGEESEPQPQKEETEPVEKTQKSSQKKAKPRD